MYEETTMSEFEIITENDYDKLLNAYIKIYDSYVFDEFSFSSETYLQIYASLLLMKRIKPR